MHSNFKLSRGGEFLALVDTDGLTIIDALNFGSQQEDVSYGRATDGGDLWTFYDSPTPGFANGTSAAEVELNLPKNFRLANRPNPFNAQTIIRYQLPESGLVRLHILDLKGRLIKTLIQGFQSNGDYSVAWDGLDMSGRNVSAGIYFVKLQQGSVSKTHKILLLK